MQLSVPTLPFNLGPSALTSAKTKPGDTAASSDVAFGTLLSAQTNPAKPAACGSDATEAAPVSAGGVSTPDTTAVLLDQPPANLDTASWLLANGLIENPAAVQSPPLGTGDLVAQPPLIENGTTDATSEGCECSPGVENPGGHIVARGKSADSSGRGRGLPDIESGLVFPNTMRNATADNAGSVEAKRTKRSELDATQPDVASAILAAGNSSPPPATVEAGADTAACVSTTSQRANAASLYGGQNGKVSPAFRNNVDAGIPTSDSSVDSVENTTPAVLPLSGQTASATETSAQGFEDARPSTDASETAVAGEVIETNGLTFNKGLGNRGPSANAARVLAGIASARSLDVPPASLVAEKFAAGSRQFDELAHGSPSRGLKKTLEVGEESVTDANATVGINVAKAESAMPALATTSSSSSAAPEAISLSAAPLSFDNLLKGDPATASLVSGARRAVESAIAITEHASNTDRSSVNLQFSVSGMDLAVRVEMRADGVHTTFRTDSPELRAALAHEWQSVAAQTPERTGRFADPTFTSSSSGSALQADAGSTHQREPGARHTENFSQPSGNPRATMRPQTVVTTHTTVPAAVTSSPGRLHTFA